MRILHVHRATGFSGSERHVADLVSALSRAGVEARVVVLEAAGGHAFSDVLRGRGIDLEVIPSRRRYELEAPRRLHDVFRVYRPDLVHTHLVHADVYGQLTARLSRRAGIVTLHSSNPFLARPPVLWAERMATRSAAHVIAISHHVERFATRLGLAGEDRLSVIPYGINASEWSSSPRERRESRRRLKVEPNAFVIGVASRLVPHKGHDILLRSMVDVLRAIPSSRLLVAGAGPLKDSLARTATDLLPGEAVSFLGHVDDMRLFLSATDAVVFPTVAGFGEGFGLAALEAMAAGRPVVASAIDSLPEVVSDGESGVLVPPGSTQDLSAALIRIGGDEQLQALLGAAGRRRAETVFPLGAMVDRTERLYRAVVTRRR